MKIINYQIMTEVNRGTKETPVMQQVFSQASVPCADADLEKKLEMIRSDAYGEVAVEDAGPDEPAEASPAEQAVWDKMAGAYAEGVKEA